MFIEYVGDYPEHGPRPIFLNSGGAYRLTKTEQLDFHLAVGLDNSAPDYIFGLGYSFRVDGLFQSMSITVRTDEPSSTAVVACRSRELRKENEAQAATWVVAYVKAVLWTSAIQTEAQLDEPSAPDYSSSSIPPRSHPRRGAAIERVCVGPETEDDRFRRSRDGTERRPHRPHFATQSVAFGAVGCVSPPTNVMLAANCRVGTRSEARPCNVVS